MGEETKNKRWNHKVGYTTDIQTIIPANDPNSFFLKSYLGRYGFCRQPVPTCSNSCVHPCMNPCMEQCMNPCMNPCMNLCANPLRVHV